jgi:hypothetical protein
MLNYQNLIKIHLNENRINQRFAKYLAARLTVIFSTSLPLTAREIMSGKRLPFDLAFLCSWW